MHETQIQAWATLIAAIAAALVSIITALKTNNVAETQKHHSEALEALSDQVAGAQMPMETERLDLPAGSPYRRS